GYPRSQGSRRQAGDPLQDPRTARYGLLAPDVALACLEDKRRPPIAVLHVKHRARNAPGQRRAAAMHTASRACRAIDGAMAPDLRLSAMAACRRLPTAARLSSDHRRNCCSTAALREKWMRGVARPIT